VEKIDHTPSGKPRRGKVIRPGAGTMTGTVWDIADRLSNLPGKPAKRRDVLAACKRANIQEVTASNQFTRWRKFHGVTGSGL